MSGGKSSCNYSSIPVVAMMIPSTMVAAIAISRIRPGPVYDARFFHRDIHNSFYGLWLIKNRRRMAVDRFRIVNALVFNALIAAMTDIVADGRAGGGADNGSDDRAATAAEFLADDAADRCADDRAENRFAMIRTGRRANADHQCGGSQ